MKDYEIYIINKHLEERKKYILKLEYFKTVINHSVVEACIEIYGYERAYIELRSKAEDEFFNKYLLQKDI